MRRFFLTLVLVSATFTLATATEAAAQTGTATQLFLAPTGRSLPKGHVYLKGLQIGAPMLQVGVTDRLSIGAASPVLAGGTLIVLTPKLQVQRSAVTSTSIGIAQFVSLGRYSGGQGVAYVAHTRELPGGAIHVAAMSVYDGAGFVTGPGVMVGGEKRLTPRATFITENYLLGHTPILSAGVRLRGSRMTCDLGWMQTRTRHGLLGGLILNAGWRF